MDNKTEEILIEHVKPLRDLLVKKYGFAYKMTITPTKLIVAKNEIVCPLEILFAEATTENDYIT